MTTAADLVIPEGRIATLPRTFVMGLFGDQGSGKSAVMAEKGIKQWKQGRRILYWPEDYGLLVPDAVPMSVTDFGVIPDALNHACVLIDEIQELMNKFRSGSTLSLQILSFFRQVRKRGSNVIFTSNSPEEINRSLPRQTNFHGDCNMVEDLKCYELGYHRKSCLDYVHIQFRDTNGRHGLVPNRKDGRKGFVQIIGGIADVYPFYNTLSIADVTEVIAATPAELAEQKQTAALGMTWDEFDHALKYQILPELVKLGVASITPKNFAATLKKEWNIPALGPPLKPEILGRHLLSIGLPSNRSSKGMVYQLPSIDYVEPWQDGVWSPGDEY